MNEKMKDCMLMAYCWLKNQKGQGMVEYGLILALIAVVAVVALTTLGTDIKGMLEGLGGKIKTPT